MSPCHKCLDTLQVATAIIAVNVFGETMNVYNIIGIILILAGVLVLNLLGNTGH